MRRFSAAHTSGMLSGFGATLGKNRVYSAQDEYGACPGSGRSANPLLTLAVRGLNPGPRERTNGLPAAWSGLKSRLESFFFHLAGLATGAQRSGSDRWLFSLFSPVWPISPSGSASPPCRCTNWSPAGAVVPSTGCSPGLASFSGCRCLLRLPSPRLSWRSGRRAGRCPPPRLMPFRMAAGLFGRPDGDAPENRRAAAKSFAGRSFAAGTLSANHLKRRKLARFAKSRPAAVESTCIHPVSWLDTPQRLEPPISSRRCPCRIGLRS